MKVKSAIGTVSVAVDHLWPGVVPLMDALGAEDLLTLVAAHAVKVSNLKANLAVKRLSYIHSIRSHSKSGLGLCLELSLDVMNCLVPLLLCFSVHYFVQFVSF